MIEIVEHTLKEVYLRIDYWEKELNGFKAVTIVPTIGGYKAVILKH